MANTTDIMITSFDDTDAIKYINEKTGLDFRQVTHGALSGGPKVLSFKAYGTCVRCIGRESINNLIEHFKSAPFESPEYAVLLIDDDNGNFNGVVTRTRGLLLLPSYEVPMPIYKSVKLAWSNALIEWESGGLDDIPDQNLHEFLDEITTEMEKRGIFVGVDDYRDK